MRGFAAGADKVQSGFILKIAVELVARVTKALNMRAFLSKFGESISRHYGESNFDKKACRFKH